MLEVREATAADTAIVLSFLRKKAEFDRDLGAFTGAIQTSEGLIRRHLFGQRPMAFSLLAEIGGRAVGFALFYFRYSSFRGRPSVWLDDLYVDQESRRAGVGLALMRRLSVVALRAGCSHIAWVVSGSNAIGMGFYVKIGASVVERVGDAVTLQIEPGHVMRILVYKRTHNGDPDQNGCFGAYDCMGTVRDRDYDAVIGVGGIGPEAQASRIAGKVNWIGIGPHKTFTGKRGPEVTFDYFLDYGTDGPDFSIVAPTLAKRMYSRNVRHVMDDLNEQEYGEIIELLRTANDVPPSGSRSLEERRSVKQRSCEQ